MAGSEERWLVPTLRQVNHDDKVHLQGVFKSMSQVQTTEAHSSAQTALRIRDLCARFDHGRAAELLDFSVEGQIPSSPKRTEIMLAGVEATLQSEVWSISLECCEIIETIAEDMPAPPDDIIHTSQITTPFGWMYVGKGLTDKNSLGLPVDLIYHALSWAVVELNVKTSEARYGLLVVPWVWSANEPGASQTVCSPIGPVIFPLGVPLKEENPEYDWEHGSMWLVKYLLATFAWSASEVAREPVKLKRQQARQQARKGRTTSEVLLVKLRRLERSERQGSGDGDSITKAHLRSGHWRWQGVGKGKQESRLTWVRPTVVRPDLLAEGELLQEKKQRIFTVDR
jgi:hypothetical protein